MKHSVAAKSLLGPKGIVENPLVEVEDGRIVRIRAHGATHGAAHRTGGVASTADFLFPDAVLSPSYFDVHIHGAAGRDLMEGTREALHTVENFLGAHGVGAFFPTTVTSPVEKTLHALDLLAGEIERGSPEKGAVPLGIHLEGPFLSPAKRGVHPASCLLEPSIPQFDRFWQVARGHIRLMTIAPELPHALELIRHATALGVRCSLGHSNALMSEAAAGFEAGASTATHTFNAMRSLGHREPGVAGFVLDNADLYADIICDGFHVAPEMVRLFFKAKGPERAILITDALAPTGMPEGKYKVGDLEVEVQGGHCVSGGIIAGSILTMDQAVRNFLKFTGCELPVATRLAAHNPAKMAGLDPDWGSLEEGREANMIALSPKGDLVQVFRAGKPVLPV